MTKKNEPEVDFTGWLYSVIQINITEGANNTVIPVDK